MARLIDFVEPGSGAKRQRGGYRCRHSGMYAVWHSHEPDVEYTATMSDSTTGVPGCNQALLRSQLEAALIEADRCDPMIAIHVDAALAMLNEKFSPAG